MLCQLPGRQLKEGEEKRQKDFKELGQFYTMSFLSNSLIKTSYSHGLLLKSEIIDPHVLLHTNARRKEGPEGLLALYSSLKAKSKKLFISVYPASNQN